MQNAYEAGMDSQARANGYVAQVTDFDGHTDDQIIDLKIADAVT